MSRRTQVIVLVSLALGLLTLYAAGTVLRLLEVLL